MTAKQKAIFTLAYFIVMLIITILSKRNLWKAVCKASGRTIQEIREKKKEFYSSSTTGRTLQMNFESWMSGNAADKERFNKLYNLYRISIIPNIIFLILSFIGLTTHTFDKVLFVGYFIVPVFAVATFAFGMIEKNK